MQNNKVIFGCGLSTIWSSSGWHFNSFLFSFFLSFTIIASRAFCLFYRLANFMQIHISSSSSASLLPNCCTAVYLQRMLINDDTHGHEESDFVDHLMICGDQRAFSRAKYVRKFINIFGRFQSQSGPGVTYIRTLIALLSVHSRPAVAESIRSRSCCCCSNTYLCHRWTAPVLKKKTKRIIINLTGIGMGRRLKHHSSAE